jgi:hypothetical protein
MNRTTGIKSLGKYPLISNCLLVVLVIVVAVVLNVLVVVVNGTLKLLTIAVSLVVTTAGLTGTIMPIACA